MALAYTENADARCHLGMSSVLQDNTATPAAADYPTGGYPVNPQNWGMGLIRAMIPVGYTGTAQNYDWEFIRAASNAITPTFAGNLKVFTFTGGVKTEVAAATDLSGGTVTLLAFGM